MSEQNHKVHFICVDNNHQQQRIDNFLCRYLKKVPKTHIYKIIRKGEVRVNKKRIKANYKLQNGDTIRIPPVISAQAKNYPVSDNLRGVLEQAILFEDNNLLVVNKPAGLAVHGGSGVQHGLIESLRQIRPEERFMELAHRLDRETSGCILIAKKRAVLLNLQQQFRAQSCDKRYLALCCGYWQGGSRQVNAPLKKNTLQSGERVVRVNSQGKPSQSVFSPIKKFSDYCLLQVILKTGRTHQIRVHAQHIGHALAGDEKYGNFACNQRLKPLGLTRMFLHAAQIRIDLKGLGLGEKIFHAPLPQSLQQVLDNLT